MTTSCCYLRWDVKWMQLLDILSALCHTVKKTQRYIFKQILKKYSRVC